MKKMIRSFLSLLCLAIMTLTACNIGGTGSTGGTPAYDREGFPITVPEQINSIIVIGAATAEILVALGMSDAIIQTDQNAANIPGIRPGISGLNMMAPDLELIISLAPDIVFGNYSVPARDLTEKGHPKSAFLMAL